MLKIVKKTLLIIVISLIIPTISCAAWSDIFSEGTSFLNKGKQAKADLTASEIKDASSSMYNILLGIGTVGATIVGGILGIQFMIASAEDKAKIKEAFIPYILGCVVIFGSFAIWKIVTNVLQNIAT